MPALHRQQDAYLLRVLACAAGVLLGGVLLFRFWPVHRDAGPAGFPESVEREAILLEEVRPTRQAASPPPPATPATPGAVRENVALAEIELDLPDYAAEPPPSTGTGKTPNALASAASGETYTAAKPVRLAVPEFDGEVPGAGGAVLVRVRVIVEETGRVGTAEILAQESAGPVGGPASLPAHMEASTLDAARRCLFQPARRNGKPVESEYVFEWRIGG